MNVNKMRRHNQTRKKDPLRGWRDLGMLSPADGVSFSAHFDALDRGIKDMARAWRFPQLFIAPWSAPPGDTSLVNMVGLRDRRIYPAGEEHIIRGTD